MKATNLVDVTKIIFKRVKKSRIENCFFSISTYTMTGSYDSKKIIHGCIQYAIRNTLTKKKPCMTYAYSRVVSFKAIEGMMGSAFAVESFEILSEFPSLHDFFLIAKQKIEPEQYIEDFDGWYFDIMNLLEYNANVRAFQPIWDSVLQKAGIKDPENDYLFVVYRADDAVKLRDFDLEENYASIPLVSLDEAYSDEEDAKELDHKTSQTPCNNQSMTIKKIKEEKLVHHPDSDFDYDEEVVKDKVTIELVHTKQVEKRQEESNEEPKEEVDQTTLEAHKESPQEPILVNKKYMLDQELINLNKQHAMSRESFLARASIVDRLNHLINVVWGQKGLYVSTFGSSLSGLGTDKADVDLCIVVPYCSNHTEYEMQLLRLLPNSVFNMNSVATYLAGTGMVNIEPINNAFVPICKFTDPVTGLHCDINTNSTLGIHNTKLIMQYMKLDVRIRPFLFALKYFVESQDINYTRGGTMSSYAYHLLALHYLMNVQHPPVIPNLQHLTGATCESKRCLYKKNISLVEGCDVRYHDCVVINNTEAEDLAITYELDEYSTLWPSNNTKGVGTLLVEFFEHYSNRDNLFKTMSISPPIEHLQMQQKWENNLIVLPDPFIRSRNVCKTVTLVGGNTICKEFKRAYDMLKEGKSFSQVAQSKDTTSRPVDKQCLDYKFGRKDLRHIQRYRPSVIY
ncbi:uncharacterized protein B0P05DRAFT_521061 [Gilbertella persicaria]|uniref:uncharacterized protein n=1 Tax=Gilbertella persicaria TaxID=101096 RepID=UPI00221F60E4|nr:uncharacterized protein B0P05DRAFT_521061 [Gilbertella persicaria]KAI8098248.1 hypothetical protein B0P05DRAFT_521061 [Gilbertella persicaria]